MLRYFGQNLEKDNCAACDMCLGELDSMKDSLETSQKIISCIVRLGQRFGGGYTAAVLTGSNDKRILDNRHDELSTYGLLSDYSQHTVHDWIEQLEGQGTFKIEVDFEDAALDQITFEIPEGAERPPPRPGR